MENFEEILNLVREKTPLVHCITNYVTVNDMANIILAGGGSPIMADEVEEVEDIVKISDSLLLNIGTINAEKLKSSLKAGKCAKELDKLVIFDPVGIGASEFRKKASREILDISRPNIIKGNISEIKFLYGENNRQKGVDGEDYNENSLDTYIDMCKNLAGRYESLIVMTGEVDIITDGEKVGLIRNGNKYLEKITGTGCMLGGLISSFALDKENLFDSSIMAVLLFTVSGDRALKYVRDKKLGLGSMKVALIDNISKLEYKDIKGEMKIEIY